MDQITALHSSFQAHLWTNSRVTIIEKIPSNRSYSTIQLLNHLQASSSSSYRRPFRKSSINTHSPQTTHTPTLLLPIHHNSPSTILLLPQIVTQPITQLSFLSFPFSPNHNPPVPKTHTTTPSKPQYRKTPITQNLLPILFSFSPRKKSVVPENQIWTRTEVLVALECM